MKPLDKIISQKILKEGSITFEKFMEMALYYPELGYYANPDVMIGTQGDFYTSPHLHPLFGAMIARQLVEMWEEMGRPAEFITVEIGAGAGYLSKDILDYLSRSSHDILSALKHIIVEPFLHFKKRQKELLKDHDDRISWHESISKMPKEITGCIFSNELIDAFPVHLVEKDDELKEVFIDFNGEIFIELIQPVINADLISCIGAFSADLPSGYRTEINLRAQKWLDEAASVLSSGFLLTIDYGYSAKEYYSAERNRGTLLCYHKHSINENPCEHVGEQDITAHVNFSSLKIWGDELGLKTLGYTSQGAYLVASGMDEVITELYADSPDYGSEIKKIKGLIMPEGMGESHMVMIQYKGEGKPKLRGFDLRNQVGKL
jgi:SAM-dependent MidA family methyltransferase